MAKSPVTTIKVPAPVEGVNLAVSVDKLKSTEAAQLKGFEFSEYGVVGIARAPRNLGGISSGTRVLAAKVFDRGASPPALFVHLSDGSIGYSVDFSTTTTLATWTFILTGQGQLPASFVQFLDAMWISTFGIGFHKVDTGMTLTSYPSAPKGFALAVWRDTLWQGNVGGSKDRIVSSGPGDPTVWPALNFVEIGKGEEGHGIVGLWPTEASLAIFKPNRTHVMFDPVDYTNRILDPDKGLSARDSLISHQGKTYFISHFGICRYLGDGPSSVISQKLQPLFDDVSAWKYGTGFSQRISVPSRGGGSSYSFGDIVGFHLPGNVTSPYVKWYPDLPEAPWVFGVPAGEPSPDRQMRFVTSRRMVVVDGAAVQWEQNQLYEISGNPATLFRHYDMPVGTSTLASEWDTSWQDFEAPMDEKWLHMIQILHRGPVDVYVRSDFDRDGPTQVAAALDHGEPELQESTVYCDSYGRSFQISVRNATAGELRSQMASGSSNIAEVARFQAGVAMLTMTATKLTAYHR
jgi:hypothetical protein